MKNRSRRLASLLSSTVSRIEQCEPRRLLSTYVVNTLSDATNPGAGLLTLRQAVVNANQHSGPDTVTFDSHVFAPGSLHTIKLSQGQITFTDKSGATTVTGSGSTVLAVSGNGLSRVFAINGGTTVSISGLTITGGVADTADSSNGNTYGGGILSAGALSLINTNIQGNAVVADGYQPGQGSNHIPGDGYGGAIYATGALTITNSTLSDNSITVSAQFNDNGVPDVGGAYGGAIYCTASLQMSGSSIVGNFAKGFVPQPGFSQETIEGGPAAGGGIWAGGTTVLSGTTFSANEAIAGSAAMSHGDGGSAIGGGLWAGGNLTVSNNTISGNNAQGGDSGLDDGASGVALGGGLFAGATINLTGTTISGNIAHGGTTGKEQQYSLAGWTTNHISAGGGVYAGASAVLSGDTLSGNSAVGGIISGADGGGIYAASNLTIQTSTLSGNSVTAELNEGTLYNESSVGGNAVGGGVAATGKTSITHSTLTGNSVTGGKGISASVFPNPGGDGLGGGIYTTAPLVVVNSTISGNSATGGAGGDGFYPGASYGKAGQNGGGGLGGGVDSTGSLTIADCTISGNTTAGGAGGAGFSGSSGPYPNGSAGDAYAGGINVAPNSTTLSNSIVSANKAAGAFSDIGGTVKSSSGYNLIGVGGGLTNGVNGNKVGITNPDLSPLGNNGGPTLTMTPLPGSPAIDAGSNALVPSGVTKDQRGLARIFNSTVDIGAVEVQPIAPQLSGKTIGTAGSYGNHGDTIAKAFDGNLSTFFDAPTANGSWVGLDLGTARIIRQISYAPRPGYATRMVGGIFQGSNSADFSSGNVTLYKITSAPKAGVLTLVPVTSWSAFRYVRYLGPSNSYCNIAELKFFGNTPTVGAALEPDGTLVVNGTSGADNIHVALSVVPSPIDISYGGATITVNGTTQVIESGIKSVVVNAGAGNDTVLVDGSEFGFDTNPRIGVTVNGGDGNDSITTKLPSSSNTPYDTQVYLDGGGGDDFLNVQNDGSATLVGGDGNDTFTSNGNEDGLFESVFGGDGNDIVEADLDTLIVVYDGGAGTNTVDFGGPNATYLLDGQIDLNQYVNVHNVILGSDNVTVIGTAGDDVITAPDAGIAGVNVQGGGGDDTVFINDAYMAIVNDTGPGASHISVQDSTNVTVIGGNGNDVIDTRTSSNVTIDGGPGTNTAYFDPGAQVKNIQNPNPKQPTTLYGVTIGTAGSYHGLGNTIANATDGNLSTYFDAPDASGDWVGLDFVSPRVVTQVKFAARAGYELRMVGGMIQASNTFDFTSGVVTLKTITYPPPSGSLKTVTLPNTTAYRYYRYIGPANSYCDIAELEFLG
jgi:hypothetical protein